MAYSSRTSPGVLGGVRVDIGRLHATWMELLFPRQLNPSRVLGRWQPETAPQKVGYYLWAALGLPLVLVGYPLLLLGFMTRFYAEKLNTATARLGTVGVVLASVVVWGALTAVTYLRQLQGSFSIEGVLAVLAASVVATLAAVLAVAFSRVGGRGVSVLFAYPAGVTALFLPPVVAALYSQTLAGIIFPNSVSLAIWLLDNVLSVGGIAEILRAQFDLKGFAYVGMWFGIAVPVGWALGLVVTLADVIRPKSDD
ncbi:hypothetical protein ACFO0N_18650 [Halobium salinum]|uniref:Yip1 domain-containing protein n=1 Tax=Halobium salinum TaxID=1364940 RepID=A0ABD5PGD7_9EURY|nr:hypothetical protein [Halobium salinum]